MQHGQGLVWQRWHVKCARRHEDDRRVELVCFWYCNGHCLLLLLVAYKSGFDDPNHAQRHNIRTTVPCKDNNVPGSVESFVIHKTVVGWGAPTGAEMA
jgi:hypothetical protein